jgi:hypothetical protein
MELKLWPWWKDRLRNDAKVRDKERAGEIKAKPEITAKPEIKIRRCYTALHKDSRHLIQKYVID